jgi:replicative superfamily II helicase
MLRFDERTRTLATTDLGRVASHFYLTASSVATINSTLTPTADYAATLNVASTCAEFENLVSREDEMAELETFAEGTPLVLRRGVDEGPGKCVALISAYIGRANVETFSLVADMAYVATNMPRVLRGGGGGGCGWGAGGGCGGFCPMGLFGSGWGGGCKMGP